jgi:hypothetical protein
MPATDLNNQRLKIKEMTPEGDPLGPIFAGRRAWGHVSAQLRNLGRKDLRRFKQRYNYP